MRNSSQRAMKAGPTGGRMMPTHWAGAIRSGGWRRGAFWMTSPQPIPASTRPISRKAMGASRRIPLMADPNAIKSRPATESPKAPNRGAKSGAAIRVNAIVSR